MHTSAVDLRNLPAKIETKELCHFGTQSSQCISRKPCLWPSIHILLWWKFSTIDFVIANLDALRGIFSCVTLEDYPLITSDHLPLSCFVEFSLSILKLLCMTVFNDRKCPSEGCDFIVPEATPLCTHFIRNHMHKSTSWNYPKLSYRLNHLLPAMTWNITPNWVYIHSSDLSFNS